MRFLRWFRKLLYPTRHYDIMGENLADLYRVMSPGNGIRVRK